MAQTCEERFAEATLRIIEHGTARCAAGFGKYPLGVREAVILLLPLIDPAYMGRDGVTIAEKMKAFNERLAQ